MTEQCEVSVSLTHTSDWHKPGNRLGTLHYVQIPLASATCRCLFHLFLYLITWLNEFCEAYFPCSVQFPCLQCSYPELFSFFMSFSLVSWGLPLGQQKPPIRRRLCSSPTGQLNFHSLPSDMCVAWTSLHNSDSLQSCLTFNQRLEAQKFPLQSLLALDMHCLPNHQA